MSSCPACGVAVIPGYVKCPKCGSALPRTKSQTSAGGTAVEGGSSRSLPFLIGASIAIAIVIIVVFAKRGSAHKVEAPPPPPISSAQPSVVPTPVPAPTVETPTPPTAEAPDPRAAASAFDAELKRRRLWGTANASGPQLVVRSGECEDAGMTQLISDQTPLLRAAGLTKFRCLTQSGAVVFERSL